MSRVWYTYFLAQEFRRENWEKVQAAPRFLCSIPLHGVLSSPSNNMPADLEDASDGLILTFILENEIASLYP